MTATRKILVRALAPACLTAVAGELSAQEPIARPPLPVPPAAVAPQRGGGCMPGNCTHRTFLGRYRCKRHLQEVALGYPEEFERPALGAAMHVPNITAIRNAEAAAMILYQYDFEPGTAALNLHGRDKLGRIAQQLPSTLYPVIVERTNGSALDEARRKAIFTALASGPFPVPIERVVVGPAIALGMSGEEALLIHQATVTRTSQAGPPIGSGSDSSSSATAK